MPIENRTLGLGPLGNNVYVLTCPETRETAVMDVGFEPEAVIELVRREQLPVKWLLCTHAHYDHIAGMLAVQKAVGGTFALHPADEPLRVRVSEQGSMFGFPPVDVPAIEHALADHEIVKLGEQELEVIATPGHAPGHVSFKHGDTIWVGDVLFRESVGRTDLPLCSWDDLVHSVRERLFVFPDHVRCLPGHGPLTTIGHEREWNPFVGDGAVRR